MTLKDLKVCVFILSLSVILLGISTSFRGDELIRQIKIARGMPMYEHFDWGWRSDVSGIAWVFYILTSSVLITTTIELGIELGIELWRGK